MRILPFKYVHVTEGLFVKVSRHFMYTDFGIRDNGEMRFTGRRFVMDSTPGSGFIERDSESHSYHQFVRKGLAHQKKPSYWRFLLGKEPSFKREIAAVRRALPDCDTKRRREILECYLNALVIAENQERFSRIIRGIKDKMGHKSNKFLVSIISHYKTKINHLEHDIKSVEFNVKDICTPQTYEAYLAVVDVFVKVAGCRRIWEHNETLHGRPNQVFFDMGVFDFIRSECYLPMLRDSNGVRYFFLPDSVIVARGSLDFDIVPLKTLTVVSQELAIEEPVEVLSSQLGDAASMIKIPEFNLTYYFNHVRPVVEFVNALDRLKETL